MGCKQDGFFFATTVPHDSATAGAAKGVDLLLKLTILVREGETEMVRN